MTIRTLRKRVEEHKSGIGDGTNVSAVYQHQIGTNHSVDYDGVRILDQGLDTFDLRLKELIHIKKNEAVLNIQQNGYFSLLLNDM